MAAKAVSLDGMKIEELMSLQGDIESRIKKMAKARQTALKAEMESLEPYLKVGKGSRTAGSKVEPKYKDPETGQTWSGRGRPPTWVLAFEQKGGKRDDLLI
ncbi:MAG: H-NS histone family protein [Pseudomonadota bacterium]